MNRCSCSLKQIRSYNARISKPLLDRIDINVEVRKVLYQELFGGQRGCSSAEMREQVFAAQNIQRQRYKDENILFNSQLDTKLCEKYVPLGKNEKEFMEYVFTKLDMTARGSFRVMKIARTIADLEGAYDVTDRHLKEAVFYRNTDGQGGL